MIGVFICRCGGNISGTVDCEKVREAAKDAPDVTTARVTDFLCSKPGLQMIRDSIRKQKLDKVVVACCSPHMHEEMFRNVVEDEGVNRYQLVHVNLREQCSWVHDRGATEKAIALVTAGTNRARTLQPLKDTEVDVSRDVLVIGGGIAGITTALQLADAGFKVNLVERRPSIGGRMAQLSKTFPTLDCSLCILSPRMAEVEIDPNISLLTNAEVDSVAGGPGNYRVTVRVRPRGVDADKCLKCGRCATVCPTEVPNEFEEGLYKRKAVFLPFPQAVPSSYAIDFESCKRCGTCVEACPAGAINLDEEDRLLEFKVGAIVVATGYDLIGNDGLKAYHPEKLGVITALQMERLIENELTEGKVLKTEGGDRVKSIAYILCAGSRDPHRGVPYCSAFCCPYSIKQAILLKKFLPYLKIWIYYTDMRMTGRGFEEFYTDCRSKGVQFIHGKPGEVTPTPDGKLEIIAEDMDTGLMLRNRVDMAVLCTAIKPSRGTDALASRLGIPLGEDLFIASKHPKLDPISTLREGIYAAGVALGPKDIHDSVIDARAAASHVSNFVGEGRLRLSPFKASVTGACDGCGACVEVCPRGAVSVSESNPVVDPVSCNGCGACVSACEAGCLQILNYTRDGLMGEVRGLISDAGDDIVLLGFFDDKISYTAADNAGTSRISYPTNMRIVRMPSTALLEWTILLDSLGHGADGVMICETEESPEAKLSERLVERVKAELGELGVEEERIRFRPMVLPIFKVLPQFISDFTAEMKKLGRIPEEKRKALLESAARRSSPSSP